MRVSNYNNKESEWWTRSRDQSNSTRVWEINTGGRVALRTTTISAGIRPAFILPENIYIKDDGTIVANTAPTVPSTITVPGTIKGGTNAAISWGASTDAQNNLAGYVLQRQVDGGTWTQVYKGTNRSYTDAITKGWNTVAYRVKAYDSLNAESAYKTSATKTVINNTAPVISGENSDLGLKTKAFNTSYTVTDPDEGQMVTVVEKIDSKQKRSFTATSGQGYSLNVTAAEWTELLNGSHTISITATDSENASSVRTYTFSKNESKVEFTQMLAMESAEMPTKCLLNIQGEFPAGSILKIEICNNGNDETPAWEEITNKVLASQKHFFTNKAKTAETWAVKVRLSLERGSAEGDCFIQSLGGNFA